MAGNSFFLSGINHGELRLGQQLTQDHLKALQQQVAENTERARALQQLQQQAQQGLRAPTKAEPGAPVAVKKEEGGIQPQQLVALAPQQLQALLALQLHQRAAAAAAAAAQQAQGGAAQQQHQQAKQVKQEVKKEVFPDEVKPGEDVETDQWVQCSKCQVWRQVPDEFWPEFENADEDEDWFCKDALWDVQEYEPHTRPCC